MSAPQADDTIARLKDALRAGRLSKADRQRAEAVIARMETPVRLSIMGKPGSGKSMLVNLLLGSRVLVSADRLPTTRITWGAEASSVLTNPDGTQDDFDGFDTADLARRKPVFVEAQLPLAALRKISVMEIVTQGAPRELQNALVWAAQRTDIAIWCTQNFDSTEQAIWQSAPDRLKDHALLLRTKADAIGDATELAHVMNALTHQVADQFKLILPLATLGAIRARRPDGGVDKDRLEASGGRALIAAVLREVDQGRNATADQAEFLLSKLEAETARAPAPAPPDTAPAAAEAKPRPSRPTLVRSEGDPGVERTPRPPVARPTPVNAAVSAPTPAAARPEPEPAVAQSAPQPKRPAAPVAPAPASDTPAERIARRACRDAVHQLARQGRSAARDLRAEGAFDPLRLVVDTAASLQDLGAQLDDIADGDGGAFAMLRDTVYDAGDLLQLMQHESGPVDAEETVSLALQIKREIEARLVA